jgi:hypothetical protein
MAEPMKQLFWLALLWASLSSVSLGKIGETEAQVDTRYGKSTGDLPTDTFGLVRGFMRNGYIVGVKLVEGVSEMEMFARTDLADMSASEIEKLRAANGAGEWKVEKLNKPGWRRWRREDGTLVVLYDANRHFLYINSTKFFEEKFGKQRGTLIDPINGLDGN